MSDAMEVLLTRRSIRKFKPDQVKREDLLKILEAGTYAPTGMNHQSPIMVVVQDPETLAAIDKMNGEVMGIDGHPFYGAPCVVIVFANSELPTFREDGSLVMGNLMNAAHALGVDSCWIHRAYQVFELPEGKELKKKWGIGDEYLGIGNCILGYRDCEYPDAKPRKEGYVIFDGE